jgi:ankyrin repeat protein
VDLPLGLPLATEVAPTSLEGDTLVRGGIYRAAMHGNTEEIAAILSDEVDADSVQYAVDSSLVVAAWKGKFEVVQFLVNRGANINFQSPNGLVTPLMMAAASGHAQIVSFLVTKGADLSIKDAHDKTALQYALDKDQHDVVKLLSGSTN